MGDSLLLSRRDRVREECGSNTVMLALGRNVVRIENREEFRHDRISKG